MDDEVDVLRRRIEELERLIARLDDECLLNPVWDGWYPELVEPLEAVLRRVYRRQRSEEIRSEED